MSMQPHCPPTEDLLRGRSRPSRSPTLPDSSHLGDVDEYVLRDRLAHLTAVLATDPRREGRSCRPPDPSAAAEEEQPDCPWCGVQCATVISTCPETCVWLSQGWAHTVTCPHTPACAAAHATDRDCRRSARLRRAD